MKFYKLLSVVIAFILFTCESFSQKDIPYKKDLIAYKDYLSAGFGITCSFPAKFTDMSKYYVMWKVREDGEKYAGSMHGPMFVSEDKECLIMYPAILFGNGEIQAKQQMKSEIGTALGYYFYRNDSLSIDSAKYDMNNYVTVVAGKKAREMFNADSFYVYDIPGSDSVYFYDKKIETIRREKFLNCTRMFITKKDRAFIDIIFLFTQKGNENKEKYIDMLSKQIWYSSFSTTDSHKQ